jgi:hypothetical protein
MPRRRFRLLDAMILVAATGMGCGVTQWVEHVSEGDLSWSALYDDCRKYVAWSSGRGWADIGEATIDLGLIVACLTMPLVAMWTLALIPIRLLGPRPRFRRLGRQPGMVSACASGVAIAIIGLWAFLEELAASMGRATPPSDQIAIVCGPMFVGLAVLAAWMTLLLGQRWCPEPTWIDRLGRVAGIYWIVVGFAVTSLFLIWAPWHTPGFRAVTINPPSAATGGPQAGEPVANEASP